MQQPRESAAIKERMAKKDFGRDEWVLVAKDDELGPELGATKAVEAGVTPQGQAFIWCLVRGRPTAEGQQPEIFAVDGSCRICQFPRLQGTISSDASTYECGLCGTVSSLEDGEVTEFLPKNNPVQWAAALANEKKGPQRMGVLQTRVSKSGNVYLRLPVSTCMLLFTSWCHCVCHLNALATSARRMAR